jgi:hypothetical protein
MVINERDILGTQLIKRDEEVNLLFEKIKIQKSTLSKSGIYFDAKVEDCQNLIDKIRAYKREIKDS